MRKIAVELSEINDLISKLTDGETIQTTTPSKDKKSQKYQLPVRHTKGGVEIDDTNKPWIVGTFLPGQFISDTHPQGHEGVDLKAPKGSPIYPIGPGKVLETNTYPKGGKTVKVSHEDGNVVSYYAHLDSVNVSPGQEVDFDTILGTMGETGNAKGRGAHLHYEVKVNNKKINPNVVTGKEIGSISKKAQFIKETIDYLEKYAKL